MSEWTRPAQPVRCKVDLTAPLTFRRERGVLVQGDENANAIVAEVYQANGVPYDLTGSTVTLTFVRPDKLAAPPISAEITGNVAVMTLTDICYRVSGMYAASVKLLNGDTERTIVRVIGEIISTENDGTVTDEQILPTPEELLVILQQVEEARENANEAARNASNAALNADNAAKNANTAAEKANKAATGAEKWSNAEASASQLATGSQPTVEVTEKDGKKIIKFGIPKGEPGKDANVTAESIDNALGYTPANDEEIPEWAKQPEKPTYTAEEVGALPEGTSIPTATSDLNNDSGFITKAVADLTNYYTNSQTYTRDEINQRLSQIPKFSISVVSSLPASGDATTIYLVRGGISEDLYTEYIWVNGAWEILGSQRVDLTGYATETWVTGQLGSYLKESELESAISTALGYTPASEDSVSQLSEKIDDLPNNKALIDKVSENVPIVKVAEQPTFVNDISECTDTSKMYVLPNGHLAAYMKTEVTTEGSTKPSYDNLVPTLIDFDGSIYNGKGYKEDTRISASSGTSERSGYVTFGIMPFVKGDIIRTKGINWISDNAAGNGDYSYVAFYTDALEASAGTSTRCNQVTDGASSIPSFGGIVFNEADGIFTFDTTNWDNTYYPQYTYLRVCGYGNGDDLIVTKNQEIKDIVTPGGTEIVTEWTDTGIEYNQPPDYSQRVTALENKTTQLRVDVDALQNKVNSGGGTSSGGMDAFAYAAYPPSPQLPGDGSDEADFNVADVPTSEVYAYMDALWSRYRTYMVRQNLGKDSSGQYDYYRYVFSKAYWRAWYKEGYPKMYAWQNGSTVIYSESVSPRVGDTMYSVPYIGTAYSTVTAVNSETIGVASTRTVNGLVFERYASGDVEPIIVYTTPFAITVNYMGRMYTAAFEASSGVKEFTHEYIVDNNDVKYYRYPFEDKRLDKTKLFSLFILANEHGNHGDSMIPCVTVMRMLKDLCGNADVQFLRWLKENAIVTVIPVGNPYGTYRNANSVNINRNYDTPGWAGSDTDPQGGTKEDGDFGPYAGSEIETQYIMNTIQQCKAQAAVSYHGRGIPEDSLIGEYNSHARFQGCGFDAERMWKVEETLFTMYNFGFVPDWHTIIDDSHNNYLNAGKSPSYIEYAGAVGGLIEIDDYEVGTHDCFTPLAMEQAYAEMLLVLQNWCEEALLRNGS